MGLQGVVHNWTAKHAHVCEGLKKRHEYWFQGYKYISASRLTCKYEKCTLESTVCNSLDFIYTSKICDEDSWCTFNWMNEGIWVTAEQSLQLCRCTTASLRLLGNMLSSLLIFFTPLPGQNREHMKLIIVYSASFVMLILSCSHMHTSGTKRMEKNRDGLMWFSIQYSFYRCSLVLEREPERFLHRCFYRSTHSQVSNCHCELKEVCTFFFWFKWAH